MGSWLRVKADMALAHTQCLRRRSTIPDPIWPTATLKELLKIGFKDQLGRQSRPPGDQAPARRELIAAAMLEMYRRCGPWTYEFMAPPGERPDPVCLVAENSNPEKQFACGGTSSAPFHHIQSTPIVCLLRTTPVAELGCHLALGWPMPARILDLFTEFRNQTNGLPTVAGTRPDWRTGRLRSRQHRHRRKRRMAQPGHAWWPVVGR